MKRVLILLTSLMAISSVTNAGVIRENWHLYLIDASGKQTVQKHSGKHKDLPVTYVYRHGCMESGAETLLLYRENGIKTDYVGFVCKEATK